MDGSLRHCTLNSELGNFTALLYHKTQQQTKECIFCYCLLFISTIFLIRSLKPNTSILCKIRPTTVCRKANTIEISTFYFFSSNCNHRQFCDRLKYLQKFIIYVALAFCRTIVRRSDGNNLVLGFNFRSFHQIVIYNMFMLSVNNNMLSTTYFLISLNLKV